MDYKKPVSQNGSELWQKLIFLQNAISLNPLDPSDVKRYLIYIERNRAKNSNVLPENRLFALGNLNRGTFQDIRIGQQDAKEFFMCLDENYSMWPDVFNLLEIGTINETECSHCNNVSRQENCYEVSSFICLDCPQESTSLKSYFESKMNGYEFRDNWRDESGCNSITTGKHRRRINDIANANYLVFIVKRLMKIDNQLLILDTKIKADMYESIILEDSQGYRANFQLLCVIHHTGNVVSTKETSGHYYADVKNSNDGTWYRTSDSQQPVDLTDKGLTENGYIFLLKKISINTNDASNEGTSSSDKL